MVRKFRHFLEYLGAAAALSLARALPPGAMMAMARGMASLAFILLRRRRRVAIRNLMATGVAATEGEAVRIARRSFQSLSLSIAESVAVPALLAGKDASRVKIKMEVPPETLAALGDASKGIILVSAHLGNWELAGKLCSNYKRVTGIARRMDNPLVQGLMDRRGIREGMDTIDKHDAHPMKIVRVLRRHEMLAILVDQHASGDAATIDFLGLPARSYTTPAVLQRLTGAPILVGAAIRNGPLDFSFHMSEPLDYGLSKESTEADILRVTQDIADRLGAYIRRWPEQYLWAHRRWKAALGKETCDKRHATCGKRHATSDNRQATIDKQQSTSNNRQATSGS